MAPITPISAPFIPLSFDESQDGIADNPPEDAPAKSSPSNTPNPKDEKVRAARASYIQHYEEMKQFANKANWPAAEKSYQKLLQDDTNYGSVLPLKDLQDGSATAFDIYKLGAQLAKQLGNALEWYDRSKLAQQINPNDQVIKTELQDITKSFSFVDILLPPNSSYTLVPNNPPFSPEARAAIDFANVQLETKGFHGLLPLIDMGVAIAYALTPASENDPQGSFDLEPIVKNSSYKKINFLEYTHSYYEMIDRLKRKQFVAAEEDYQGILRSGIKIDGNGYYLGFQIAMENGNTLEAYKRAGQALENNPSDALKTQVEQEIGLIEGNYGLVQMTGGRNVSLTYSPDFVGTTDDQEWAKKSIDFAKAQLAQKGSFTGLIPVDNYLNLAAGLIQYTFTRRGIPVRDKSFTFQSITQREANKDYQQIDLSPSGPQVKEPLKAGPFVAFGISGGYAQLQTSSGPPQTYSGGSIGATAKGMWFAPLGKSGFMLAPQASLTLMGDFYDPFSVANFNGFVGLSAGYGRKDFLLGGGVLLAGGFQAPSANGTVTVGTLAPSIKVDRVIQTPIGGLFVYVNPGKFFFEVEWQHATPGLEGEMSQYAGTRSGGAFDNDRFIFTAAIKIK